jgi:hypothetical protein
MDSEESSPIDTDPSQKIADPNSSDDEVNEAKTLKDRFGFFVTDKFHKHKDISSEVKNQRKAKESERSRKWIKMIKNWDKYSGPSRIEKLKTRTRKGIPDVARGYAWYHFVHGEDVKKKYPDVRQINTSDLSTVVIDEVNNLRERILFLLLFHSFLLH